MPSPSPSVSESVGLLSRWYPTDRTPSLSESRSRELRQVVGRRVVPDIECRDRCHRARRMKTDPLGWMEGSIGSTSSQLMLPSWPSACPPPVPVGLRTGPRYRPAKGSRKQCAGPRRHRCRDHRLVTSCVDVDGSGRRCRRRRICLVPMQGERSRLGLCSPPNGGRSNDRARPARVRSPSRSRPTARRGCVQVPLAASKYFGN